MQLYIYAVRFTSSVLAALQLCFMFNTAMNYLGEALLAVILEVFGVDIDVIPVDTVWLGKLGGVLNKLLHLHRRRVSAQLFKGLNWYIG